MNILIAMNGSYSKTAGGLERTTYILLNYLNSIKGIKCFGIFSKLEENHLLVYEHTLTNQFPLYNFIIEHSIDIIYFPAGPWYVKTFKDQINKADCKIIFAYHSAPGYEDIHIKPNLIRRSKKRNVGFIYALINTYFYNSYRNYLKSKSRKLMQDGYNNSHALVLLSERLKNSFNTHYDLKDTKKIYFIGNPLSFKSNICDAKILAKENIILVVSRLDEVNKRISLSIKAWAKLHDKYPDWKMIILGDGRDRELYKKMIIDLNIKNIELKGRLDPESFYTKAKIFHMTSNFEGWGMTITEAQQKGVVPIIMDSFNSLHEIIPSKKSGAIIIDNNNLNQLICATEFLINQEKNRFELIQQGLLNTSRFNIDNIGKKWLNLFNKVMNEKQT